MQPLTATSGAGECGTGRVNSIRVAGKKYV